MKLLPYRELDAGRNWAAVGTWPCRWIAVPALATPPFLAAYRLRFTLPAAATLRLHVSADERYALYCDGARLGRGPERGDLSRWHYETYELPLAAGTHCLVAKVWSLGALAPMAQVSARHGFLLGGEGPFQEQLSTGVAPWEGMRVSGCEFLPATLLWGAGARVRLDGAAWPWGVEEIGRAHV